MDDDLNGATVNDILIGGYGADTFVLSTKKVTIHDFSINDGDVMNAPKQHNLSLIQQGDRLLLTDNSRNIHTAILNLCADQLINHQPDLI